MLVKVLKGGKVHYAWILLSACCVYSLALQGVFSYCSGIFYVPVSTALGISVGKFSTSSTIFTVAMSLSSPIAGRAFSPKHFRVQMAGAAFMICGFFALLSRAQALWHWYVLMAAIGVCGAFLIIMPVPILINNWFYKSNGLALSIISAFSGLSGAIIAPLGTRIILTVGWRSAYCLLGLSAAILSLPAILLFFCYSPEQAGLEPYGKSGGMPTRAASLETATSRSIRVQVLITVSLLAAFKSFYNHYSSFAVSIGLSQMTGASLMSVIMIGTIVFRLALGILNDRAGIQKTVFISLALVSLALLCIAFLNWNLPLLMLGTFLLGMGPAMFSVLPPLVIRAICAPSEYTRIFPVITMAYTLSSALSNQAIGLLYDACGTYRPAMLLGVAAAALSAVTAERGFRARRAQIP